MIRTFPLFSFFPVKIICCLFITYYGHFAICEDDVIFMNKLPGSTDRNIVFDMLVGFSYSKLTFERILCYYY